MLREVAAAKAHIAPHGSKTEAFKTVADVLNSNVDFVPHMDSKSVRDRYERLQKAADKEDRHDAMRSGVGGEFTEQQELLSQMREAREEQKLEKLKSMEALREREQKKLEAGQRLVEQATAFSASGASVVVSDDDSGD